MLLYTLIDLLFFYSALSFKINNILTYHKYNQILITSSKQAPNVYTMKVYCARRSNNQDTILLSRSKHNQKITNIIKYEFIEKLVLSESWAVTQSHTEF